MDFIIGYAHLMLIIVSFFLASFDPLCTTCRVRILGDASVVSISLCVRIS